MRWPRPFSRAAPPGFDTEEPGTKAEAEAESDSPLIERSAPGIAALFEGLVDDGSHAVLDLGPAAPNSFELYSRFARRIRFADLLNPTLRGEAWTGALRSLQPYPEQPYDLVLAWNLLDRIRPAERLHFVERLAQITTSRARLYVVVDVSGEPATCPLRFTLLGLDRVGQRPMGDPHPAFPQLLPAEVERLLRPFRVVHGFTLRHGYREYVAIRR